MSKSHTFMRGLGSPALTKWGLKNLESKKPTILCGVSVDGKKIMVMTNQPEILMSFEDFLEVSESFQKTILQAKHLQSNPIQVPPENGN